jgi:vitamin B12 transporter
MIKLFFLNYCILFCFVSKLFADSVPVIVISPGKTTQSLGTIGTSVTVIDEKTINDSSENFLGNILNDNASSLNIFQSGGVGNVMGVQLRGLEKRYSTIYIDGIKMSDPSSPDNSFYIQNILKGSIDRVEILKGNQSTLYGPNAIGGTIHIFTKKGKENQKPSVKFDLGSNGTKNLNYSIGGANRKMNYFFGLDHFFTKGVSARNDDTENDEYKSKGINTNYSYNFNDNLKIETSLRYVNANLNYDEVNKSNSDLINKSNDNEGSYSLKFIQKKNQYNNELIYNKTYIERKTNEFANGKQNYFGYRDSLSWVGTYNFNLDNRIVYGSDFEIEAARYNGDYAPSATGWKKTLMDKTADENIFSLYFDYQFRPFQNLFTTFGLRTDDHSSSGRKMSGRTTMAFKVDEKSKISTSYGSGIRFPSLYDLHYADGNTNISGGGTYPNDGYLGLTVEDIKSERANSFDLGYERVFKNFDLDLNINYFFIEQKNPLNSDSRNNWKMQNTMGVNETEGLEFQLSWNPAEKNYAIDLNYTFTDTYDSNTCNSDIVSNRGCNLTSSNLGNAKVRVPRNSFVSNLYFNKFKNFSNLIKIKYVDEVRDFGDINNNFKDVILDDYMTIDFISKLKMYDNYFLSFSAKNMFDANYEQANGYSSLGRSFFFGINRVY